MVGGGYDQGASRGRGIDLVWKAIRICRLDVGGREILTRARGRWTCCFPLGDEKEKGVGEVVGDPVEGQVDRRRS